MRVGCWMWWSCTRSGRHWLIVIAVARCARCPKVLAEAKPRELGSPNMWLAWGLACGSPPAPPANGALRWCALVAWCAVASHAQRRQVACSGIQWCATGGSAACSACSSGLGDGSQESPDSRFHSVRLAPLQPSSVSGSQSQGEGETTRLSRQLTDTPTHACATLNCRELFLLVLDTGTETNTGTPGGHVHIALVRDGTLFLSPSRSLARSLHLRLPTSRLGACF